MKKGKEKLEKHGLLVLLGILCVVILGLGVGIWFLNNRNDSSSDMDESDRVVLTDTMEGWDGSISEATQALVLSENIKDRLDNDENYDIENAISDYENAYNQSSGNLRFNVAIEYSYFVLEFIDDLDVAINVIESVEDLIDLDYNNKNYYYTTLYTLCSMANDETRAEQYKKILDDIIENQEVIE